MIKDLANYAEAESLSQENLKQMCEYYEVSIDHPKNIAELVKKTINCLTQTVFQNVSEELEIEHENEKLERKKIVKKFSNEIASQPDQS